MWPCKTTTFVSKAQYSLIVPESAVKPQSINYLCQCHVKGVLGVLQQPDPQFWGPAISRSGKFLRAV